MNCGQCGKIHTRCSSHKASDPTEPCQRYPRAGATVCDSHGGKAPQVKARAAVRAEVMRWGLGDPDVDPGVMMLRLVSQSSARVDFYASLVEQAYAAAERLRLAEQPPQSDLLEAETARLDLERIFNTGGVGALIGHTYAGTQTSGVIATGEKIRGLVDLESQERDRLAGFCAKAVAAGLAERMIRQAEKYGAMIAAMFAALAQGLGHDPKDPQVAELIRQTIAQGTGLDSRVIEGRAA